MRNVHLCRITGRQVLAQSFISITVECGDIAASARAGQFLHIKCGENFLLRRPVSICSVRGNTVTFVFEVKGEGTGRLSEYMPGETLDILGPLGNGFSLPDGRVVVVGGGAGVPPLLFAAELAKPRATAILGFRDSSRVILRGEFVETCAEVYITTDDGSLGIHGQVTGPLEALLKNGGYEAVLACGPRNMLYHTAALCGRFGVPCQVSLEERMGCGVGACLVCACATVADGEPRMSRVCRDGPVFDAGEVAWNYTIHNA